jgi:hypothetical protein
LAKHLGFDINFTENSFNVVELEVGVHLLVGWVTLEGGQGEGLQVVALMVAQPVHCLLV